MLKNPQNPKTEGVRKDFVTNSSNNEQIREIQESSATGNSTEGIKGIKKKNNPRKSQQTNDYPTAIIQKCLMLSLNSKEKGNKMPETRKLPSRMEL